MNNIRDLNWSIIGAWLLLATIGLVAIFSATQGPVSEFLPNYIQNNFAKQLVWVALYAVLLYLLWDWDNFNDFNSSLWNRDKWS